MTEYKIASNFLLFEELDSDSIGINFRAAKIENRRPKGHILLTEVYPFLSENKDIWKRIKILMEGIHKSNIPNLYAPAEIIKEETKALMVFPMLKGRTFEKVLEDSAKKDLPINFDLTLSIALAIADLIDIGSSIVVSGEKSFHGFLTPDNIIVDYDGKILLRNYGIYPYLGKNEVIYNEMVKKYGAWLAPEFLRKEKLSPQTDVYYLGYIIYRILTGEYFSYSENENFDNKFSNISFTHHIPSSDKDFLTNIITFFKKTLDPRPENRFVNMKEFKDYIAQNFHIEELSSVTFSLAYFMNSLYMEAMEEEPKMLQKELEYVVPLPKIEKPVQKSEQDSHLAEEILAGLDERKGFNPKILIGIAAVIIILIVIGYYYISNAKEEARLEQEQIRIALQKKEEERKKVEANMLAMQEQLKALQTQATATDEEKQEKAKKEEEFKTKLQELNKQNEALLEEKKAIAAKQEEEAKQKQEEADRAEKDRIAKAAEEAKKKEREQLEKQLNTVEPGSEIPYSDATVKPELITGKFPKMSAAIKKRYAAGQKISISANILIDENGNVTNVAILGKIPPDIKDAVTKGLIIWKYKPAEKNGVKVKVWKLVTDTIEF